MTTPVSVGLEGFSGRVAVSVGFSGGEDTDGTSFFTSTAGAVSAGTAGTATGGVAMAGGSEIVGTSGLATSLGGTQTTQNPLIKEKPSN